MLASWEVRVTDLVLEFAHAFRALVPHLEATRVGWRGSDRYDDFDRIAEALYVPFVLSPVVHDPKFSDLDLAEFRPFGFGQGDWGAEVIGLPSDGRRPLPLVDLDSLDQPFDTAVLGPIGSVAVPLTVTDFQVARRERDPVATLKVDP